MLLVRCKTLAGAEGQAAYSEVLASLLLCYTFCCYPFSPSVELQLFCGDVAKGGGAGGGATKLCCAAVLLEGSSKLREALDMVDGEEGGERQAIDDQCSY